MNVQSHLRYYRKLNLSFMLGSCLKLIHVLCVCRLSSDFPDDRSSFFLKNRKLNYVIDYYVRYIPNYKFHFKLLYMVPVIIAKTKWAPRRDKTYLKNFFHLIEKIILLDIENVTKKKVYLFMYYISDTNLIHRK